MRLADGHQPDRGVGGSENQLVQPVGARPGLHGGQAFVHQTPFQLGPFGREAQRVVVIQPVRRQRIIGGDERVVGPHDGRRRLLHRLGRGLHRDPQAGKPRHGPTREAQVDDVLHRAGVQHRHADVLKNVFGLVRIRRGMRPVIVPGDGQHPAVAMRARHVGAVERVAGPVHAGTFAVPHTIDAIDPLAGEGVDLLRAHQHGGGEVLVHPRLEPDVVGLHQLSLQP